MNLYSTYSPEDTAIIIHFTDPYASYDTIHIEINNILDWSDNETDTKQLTYTTYLLADYDNDFDLFIGNFNGTIQFFENIGNEEEPIYEFVEVLPDIDLSGYSSPEFIDIDSDEDYDLLVGNMNGNIFFYENKLLWIDWSVW